MMNLQPTDRSTPVNQSRRHADSPVRERLTRHLRRHLGAWPPRAPHEIVVSPERDRPGWDGRVRPIQGVLTPEGSVLAVSPRHEALFEGVDPEEVLRDLGAPDAQRRVSRRLGFPVGVGTATLRWSERAAELPTIGEWASADDPRLPGWLAPFHGNVLAAFDERGAFAAGVGLKDHRDAHELAVGTDPAHRGQGYARMLVAQAARDIIKRGSVPLYRHEDHNFASARVAEASGFPDRGWRSIDLDVGHLSP